MKELVTIILGKDVEKFDGKRIDLSYRNSHRETLIKIIKRLEEFGFNISINYNLTGDEIADDFAALGNVVILNLNNQIYFLKLPETLTEKQILELRKIEQEIQEKRTFEQTVDNKGSIIKAKEFKLNYNYKKNNNQ